MLIAKHFALRMAHVATHEGSTHLHILNQKPTFAWFRVTLRNLVHSVIKKSIRWHPLRARLAATSCVTAQRHTPTLIASLCLMLCLHCAAIGLQPFLPAPAGGTRGHIRRPSSCGLSGSQGELQCRLLPGTAWLPLAAGAFTWPFC